MMNYELRVSDCPVAVADRFFCCTRYRDRRPPDGPLPPIRFLAWES